MQKYDTHRKQNTTVRTATPGRDTLAAAPMPVLTRPMPARRVDLPDAMREKMEGAFGMDFSSVRLYESQSVDDMGANAFAQGDRITFAPGKLNFQSSTGQALLGHELSHITSQARGESRGRGLLNDASLEAKADREGAMAAAGETIYSGAATGAPLAASGAPVQASWKNALEGWKYGTGVWGLLSDADTFANGSFSSENSEPTTFTGIDENHREENRKKNVAKGAIGATIGAVNTGISALDTGKKYYGGDVTGSIAGTLDTIAALGDTGAGVAGAVNSGVYQTEKALGLGEYAGKTTADEIKENKKTAKGIKTGTSITGIVTNGLRTISGLTSAIGGKVAQHRLGSLLGGNPTFTNDANDDSTTPEMRNAIKQAKRNSRVNMWSGLTKSLGSGLKSIGTGISGFVDSGTGLAVGQSLSLAGDLVGLFNTWNTGRMKKNAQKETLREAGLDAAIQAKIAAERDRIVNAGGSFTDADRKAAKQAAKQDFARRKGIDGMLQGGLSRSSLYAALSKKRADTMVDIAEDHDAADGGVPVDETAGKAISAMGIHAGSAKRKKAGVLAKLLG